MVPSLLKDRQLYFVHYILKNDILSCPSIWLSLKKKARNGFWRILNPDTPLILLSGQHFKDNMTETDIHHAISVGFIIDNRMIVDCNHNTWVRGIQTPGHAVHHSPFCIIYTLREHKFRKPDIHWIELFFNSVCSMQWIYTQTTAQWNLIVGCAEFQIKEDTYRWGYGLLW